MDRYCRVLQKRKNPPLIVVVASKQELTNVYYTRRLWMAARNMGISRREWPNVIAQSIYDYKGKIYCPDGRKWYIPHVDDVLGDPRWFSYYFEEQDGLPRRKVRLIEKLKLIDLYFRISKPDIQRHFGR